MKEHSHLNKTYTAAVTISEDQLPLLHKMQHWMRFFWNKAMTEYERRLRVCKQKSLWKKSFVDNPAHAEKIVKKLLKENGHRKFIDMINDYLSMMDAIPDNLKDPPSMKVDLKTEGTNAMSLNNWISVLKKQYPQSWGSVSTDPMREVVRRLDGMWKSYFSNLKSGSKTMRKPSRYSKGYPTVLIWSNPTIKTVETKDGPASSLLLLCGKKQKLTIPLGDYLLRSIRGKKVVRVDLLLDKKSGRYRVGLVVKYDKPESRHKGVVRALDFGSGDIGIADSDGSLALVAMRRPEKANRRRLANLDDQLFRGGLTKGSRRYNKLLAARKKLHGRLRHQRETTQRRIADQLCSPNVYSIVIGKTSTREGIARDSKNSPLQHHGAQNTGGMSRMVTFIKEKCAERGITLIEGLDPARKGDLSDSTSKVYAARNLLENNKDSYSCVLEPSSEEVKRLRIWTRKKSKRPNRSFEKTQV